MSHLKLNEILKSDSSDPVLVSSDNMQSVHSINCYIYVQTYKKWLLRRH